MKTATVIGATGLIGGHLIDVLLKDNRYNKVKVLVRRSFTYNNPEVQVSVIDFTDEQQFKAAITGSDALFCATGTTRKKVRGNMNAYRKVDYDIPVNAARYCSETGCHHFLIVSSVGANSMSNNFYLKLKGEAEDALKSMKIPCVSVFRPSILLGKRKEFRFSELIAKQLASFFSFLIPSEYKPVQARNVALAMVEASLEDAPGMRVYHYEDMMKLIKNDRSPH